MKRFLAFLMLPALLFSWSPSLETIGRVGNYRKGGGALVFAPMGQDGCRILFGQGHAGIFRELYVGSIGAGYRQKQEWYAWGVNGFFDVARSNSQRVYYQGGIGAEWITNCWVARANGYFPSQNRHRLNLRRVSDVQINGTALIATDNFFETLEQGYLGFDLEVGYGKEIGCGQLWGYVGYYRFDASKVKQMSGPRLRLDYTLDNAIGWCPLEIKVGGEWERNNVHGSTLSGYLSLRIPFGNTHRSASCCDSLCRQMGDPVYRNRAIWVDRQEILSNWPITFTLPQSIFFANEGGTGTGTQSSPFDLDGAVAAATTAGDIIFALADGGAHTPAVPVILLDEQQFYGFGPNGQATIDLGEGRSVNVRPLASTSAATINPSVGPVVLVGDNNKINGLIVDSTGVTAAITPTAPIQNLSICDTLLQNGVAFGIDGSTFNIVNTSLLRSTLTNFPVAGILLPLDPQTISLRRSRFDTQPGGILRVTNATGPVDILVRGCQGTTTGSIIDFPAGPSTGVNLLFDGCVFDDFLTAVASGATPAPASRYNQVVVANQLGLTTPATGDIVNLALPSSAQSNEWIVARNQASNLPAGLPLVTDLSAFSSNGHQFNLSVLENQFQNNGVTAVFRGNTGAFPGAVANTRVHNNQITGIGGIVEITRPDPYQALLTVDGNSSAMGTIVLENDSATSTYQVTNLSVLPSLNSGVPVDTSSSAFPEFIRSSAIP